MSGSSSAASRWRCELAAVRELQAALRLTRAARGGAGGAGGAGGRGLSQPDPSVPEDLRFFEQLRVWMQAFPPAERDRTYQQKFAPLGLFAADSPYGAGDSELTASLRAGLVVGRETMERALRNSDAPKQNGWDVAYHSFDYNLDFFELGTLDEPRWKLADDPSRYLKRALAARGGLWGNHGYEADPLRSRRRDRQATREQLRVDRP